MAKPDLLLEPLFSSYLDTDVWYDASRGVLVLRDQRQYAIHSNDGQLILRNTRRSPGAVLPFVYQPVPPPTYNQTQTASRPEVRAEPIDVPQGYDGLTAGLQAVKLSDRGTVGLLESRKGTRC
jgi:hypothetical protein